jgi:hypothetical protein
MTFVIMLDKELAAHSSDWPITTEQDTLDAIRNITQHFGNPLLVPRQSRSMEQIEATVLTNSATGQVDNGAIFRSMPTP